MPVSQKAQPFHDLTSKNEPYLYLRNHIRSAMSFSAAVQSVCIEIIRAAYQFSHGFTLLIYLFSRSSWIGVRTFDDTIPEVRILKSFEKNK